MNKTIKTVFELLLFSTIAALVIWGTANLMLPLVTTQQISFLQAFALVWLLRSLKFTIVSWD